MTSSVHFKFKSQKEPSRVTFDGTGISVFELKREIINQNRLGDGSDFELAIYNEDTNEEYDDDTTIIPRSTSVIARRLPAARPGKGGAARYVSGKMPVNARSSSRIEPPTSNRTVSGGGAIINNIPDLNAAQSEDEKIKALFSLQETQWKEQQNEMANATPVPFNRSRGKPVNVPDHPPPPGYLCYRCREKGHWIQACPTNNDPKFDGRYRVKRSTGIPRSLQKQVEKPDSLALDGSNEDSKLSGVMVNADGDFVVAQPDKASWELYQEKAKASAAAAAEFAAAEGSREIQARGLQCPIDKRLLLEPTKTPCCKKTYCNDCITNALIESDFVCPNCSTEGVLLDNLTVDQEAVGKLKDYQKEKAEKKEKEREQSVSEKSTVSPPRVVSEPANQKYVSTSSPKLPTQPSPTCLKKRPVGEGDENASGQDVVATAPAMKKQKSNDGQPHVNSHHNQKGEIHNGFSPSPFHQQLPFGNFNSPSPQHFQMTGFPQQNVMPMPGFIGNVDSSTPMLNGYAQGENGWNQMASNNMNFGMPNGPYTNSFSQPMMPFGGYGPSNFGPGPGGMMPMSMNFMNQPPSHLPQRPPFQQNIGMAPFSNQQRTSFGRPFAKEEDNAYLRQPVNPHRHQARQKRIRPSDYREL
ncbi:zinc knuckle domain-containing protein [Blastomyces dermatitidis ER-3]|uniref:Zinc knuckle domain-containing protein n=2 Tax=Ajellomyces dermatitidis TaxID=5039 RepID=F2TQ36_AJEDA|nr:zinc knuckle domain-containing protein [Blastomyces dermatitidis ER-3]EEQ86223.1 zinc knuckle domain-containing protein [Blastomyces dermatitidis ER-3]EGE85349.1 zinc knuckle domain-containing protein [Blastomyces dermatitidis ATCC 18188]EQL30044.1 hypothetical protein BDFG_07438 [Blastomyces dermatitidis ATCC 26199]